MISIEAATADQAWRKAGIQLQNQIEIQSGRGQPTRELLHVAFSISEPRQRVVFARPINPAFAVAEVIWILAGGNASDFMIAWNPRFKRFLDSDRRAFHGAYGFRLGSNPTLSENADRMLRIHDGDKRPDQLRMAYEALRQEPDSRQAVLQIWDTQRDLPNPSPSSKDIPCNVVCHPMIRQGRLEWLQIMRSNDLIWGTPYNFVQFTSIQEIMAGWLGLDVGSYVHVSDSLHVYEHHWTELDAMVLDNGHDLPWNHADLRIEGYEPWEKAFATVVDAAVELSENVDPQKARQVENRVYHLPTSYREWVALLAAEALRRDGHDEAALDIVEGAGAYWARSWQIWYEQRTGLSEPLTSRIAS